MYPKSIAGKLLFYFRSALVVVWFFGVSFLLFLVSVFRPFHHANATLFCRLLSPTALWLLGLNVKLYGAEIALKNRPCIFVGNHQHLLDLFTYSYILPDRTITLGKKSIRVVPVFGWLYWLSGQLLIDRSNNERAIQTLKRGERMLQEKQLSILVFPEGTRSRGKPMGRFKKGAFHLAIETGFPIVPIAGSNVHTTLHLGQWNAGTISMRVLEPMSVVGKTQDDVGSLMEEAREKIKNAVAALDAELLSERSSPR